MAKAAEKISLVNAVVSRDRFLRQEAVRNIVDAIQADSGACDVTRMDGAEADVAEVLDEVRTFSLFALRRVVVVDNADSLISNARAVMERYCTEPSSTGHLVLLCDSLPKNTKIYRIIEREGGVMPCDPPKGRALGGWLTDRAQRIHGKRLQSAAAERIREFIGESPGALDAELGKLAAFIGDRKEITDGDVAMATGMHREENVFAVTDAMMSNDPALALNRWDRVLATDRSAPGRAIAGLAWGVRRLLEAQHDRQRGASVFELSRKLFTDPATVERRLRWATPARLERQLGELLDADLKVKTGASTFESAVEAFIVRHSISDVMSAQG